MVSVSNFQVIKVSTDDWMVHLYRYSWIPGLVHPLDFSYSYTATNFFVFIRTCRLLAECVGTVQT